MGLRRSGGLQVQYLSGTTVTEFKAQYSLNVQVNLNRDSESRWLKLRRSLRNQTASNFFKLKYTKFNGGSGTSDHGHHGVTGRLAGRTRPILPEVCHVLTRYSDSCRKDSRTAYATVLCLIFVYHTILVQLFKWMKIMLRLGSRQEGVVLLYIIQDQQECEQNTSDRLGA
jgi:hypothetical protein